MMNRHDRSGAQWRVQVIDRLRAGARPLVLSVVLMSVVLVFSVRLAPSLASQGRDSAVFAMVGRVILEGGLPYRDAWDNKTPGVYVLNALAMAVFGPNQWALWIGEMFVLCVTTALMASLLWRLTQQRLTTAAGTFIFVALARHPGFATSGNFTESYALLPQVACFLVGYAFLVHPSRRLAFGLGAAASAIFLVKQSSIGVALVFLPALMLSLHPVTRAPRRWGWLVMFVLGGVSVSGVVAVYFAWHGVLGTALDAMLVHPTAYHEWVDIEPTPWWWAGWDSLTQSPVILVLGPLLPLYWVGLQGVRRRLRSMCSVDSRAAASGAVTVWAAVTLLLDLWLVNVTGRAYGHYYITLAPAAALLTATGLAEIIKSHRARARLVAGIAAYTVIASTLHPLGVTVQTAARADEDIWGPARQTALAGYVETHTRAGDRVLVWGARAQVNFQSGRLSSTRYHYSYALIVEGYTTGERVRDLIADLKAHPPALIVDTGRADGPWVPPLDPVIRESWRDGKGRPAIAALDPFFDYVAQTCQVQAALDLVIVYECAGANGHLTPDAGSTLARQDGSDARYHAILSVPAHP